MRSITCCTQRVTFLTCIGMMVQKVALAAVLYTVVTLTVLGSCLAAQTDAGGGVGVVKSTRTAWGMTSWQPKKGTLTPFWRWKNIWLNSCSLTLQKWACFLNYDLKSAQTLYNGVFCIDYNRLFNFYDVINMIWNPKLSSNTFEHSSQYS